MGRAECRSDMIRSDAITLVCLYVDQLRVSLSDSQRLKMPRHVFVDHVACSRKPPQQREKTQVT